MWCSCTGGGRDRGFTSPPETEDLWVCTRCLKPTRLVFEKVTDMLVPKGATALLSVRSRDDGISECKFATPDGKKICLTYHPYPRKVNMDQGRELLLNVWHMLDAATDRVMEMSDVASKAQARAYAEVLAQFMQPFFNSPDDIVREAVARYKARQAGTEHETPGLAEAIWDPTKNWDGTPRVPPGADTGTPRKSVAPRRAQLQPEQEAFVRKALGEGIMGAAALAGMFKVPVEVIEGYRG